MKSYDEWTKEESESFEDDILIDDETARAFDILIAKDFTPEQYYAAYKYYLRETQRDER